jgi:hypothetical protein
MWDLQDSIQRTSLLEEVLLNVLEAKAADAQKSTGICLILTLGGRLMNVPARRVRLVVSWRMILQAQM